MVRQNSACSNCRAANVRCEFKTKSEPCKRCLKYNNDCVIPRQKMSQRLACLFCRKSKIICEIGPEGTDGSCNQCRRRSLKCQFSKQSGGGKHVSSDLISSEPENETFAASPWDWNSLSMTSAPESTMGFTNPPTPSNRLHIPLSLDHPMSSSTALWELDLETERTSGWP
ncbi:hypothetical protein C8J56DRAFT_482929 [Mycena floridula]|nr:hypothetical protein C8J56DRAFT_482929 [Mycena floridula]